ncbi:MAG: alpha/beta hydrolase [Chloroflexota bacterium]
MNNLIGYLEALIEIWKIEKVNLVGISMGGALSIGYTLQNPNCVQSMTLVGSYGIQDYAPAHHMSYFLVRMPWLLDASWRMMRGSRWAAKYTLSNIVHNPEARTDDVIDELMEALANPDSQKAFSQWQRDEVQWEGLKTNYSEQLHRIEQPILMVHGTHDVGVPLKYAQRAVTKFQKAQLEIFENAGHWTQRDFPNKFNHLLGEFLSNISAS